MSQLMTLFSKLLPGTKKNNLNAPHALHDFENNYFVGQFLGKGSYGLVKEVMRKSDSMKFACKIIKKNEIKGIILRTDVKKYTTIITFHSFGQRS